MAEGEREVEAKRIVVSDRPRVVVERVAALESLAGYLLVDRGEVRLRDVYFDTEDSGLLGRRAALRLRHEGPAVRIALKVEGREVRPGTSDRAELELPWSDEALERVSDAVGALGLRLSRAAPAGGAPAEVLGRMGLRVVQDRATVRRVRDVVRGPGVAPVAELVVDSVGYGAGGREVWHHEVEVEARGEPGAAALEALEHALAALFPGELLPWPHSKQATGRAVETLLADPDAAGLLGPGGDLAPGAYARVDRLLAGGGAPSSAPPSPGAPRSR